MILSFFFLIFIKYKMEHDKTSKLADVQTKPADLLVGDLADMDVPAEPAAVVKTTEPAEPAAATKAATKAAKTTKNPKRVEQGKRSAEWNKAKRRQLLEDAPTRPALKQVEDATRPAFKQVERTKSKTKTTF